MARAATVLVYGTLKRGFHNHSALASARYLGDGTTMDSFPLVADECFVPYLLDRVGQGTRVTGELYRVDDEGFARLDRLENYPRYYDRREVLVGVDGAGDADELAQLARSGAVRCWVYLKVQVSDELLAMPHMAEYALEEHRAKYVPREQRDASHISKRTGPQLDHG